MNQVPKRNNEAGFTMVELTLSMAFIALLLLAIAILTLQISSIYNKGFTMRAVNESGQLIVSDIQRTLSGSRPTDVDTASDTTGGRLCANNVVYAWNYAGSLTNGFNDFSGDPNREVRMLRFLGDNNYCVKNDDDTYDAIPANSGTLTELLKAGDNTLAIHSFTVAPDPTDSTKYGTAVTGDDTQRMYDVAFVIGTSEQSVIQGLINGNGCSVPENRTEDEYCAVNEFRFIARAGSKGADDVAGN